MKTNEELCEDVLKVLQVESSSGFEQVLISAKDGVLTLSGSVEKAHQKQQAEYVAMRVTGVIVAANQIVVLSRHPVTCFRPPWHICSENDSRKLQDIHFQTADNKVTLTGTVNSIDEKNEAARLAWTTPGIDIVYNELIITS